MCAHRKRVEDDTHISHKPILLRHDATLLKYTHENKKFLFFSLHLYYLWHEYFYYILSTCYISFLCLYLCEYFPSLCVTKENWRGDWGKIDNNVHTWKKKKKRKISIYDEKKAFLIFLILPFSLPSLSNDCKIASSSTSLMSSKMSMLWHDDIHWRKGRKNLLSTTKTGNFLFTLCFMT